MYVCMYVLPRVGELCWVTGWGRPNAGDAKPEYLQQVSVPIVNQTHCSKFYPKHYDNQTMICAGMEHGGDELCKWDFGGPMVCLTDGRFYLQGVVISRKGCAQPKRFGVYSKVKQFLRWIDEETD